MKPSFSDLLQPAPLSARFSDPAYYVWCGSAVKADDGLYHLFYSRWPRHCGFNAWVTHSEIARAVAESPFGPYRHQEAVLPARGAGFWDGLCTHNPTVHRFGGRFYLYYMGNTGDGINTRELNWSHRNNQRIGVAVADSPEGPWRRSDTPLIDATPGFYDALCANNPSVTARPGGGYLMIYKAVDRKRPLPFGGPVLHCAALGDHPAGPFHKQPDPVFTSEGVDFAAEDPFIWRGKDRYYAIVKDMQGSFTKAGRSLALFESGDGLKWGLSTDPLVSTTRVRWVDGRMQELEALERPQLLFENGVPIALLCAADEEETHRETFNVQIPLKGSARFF
jgi:hypothetical protein